MSVSINPDNAPRPLVVIAEKYQSLQGPWHSHRRTQLVYASQGIITVSIPSGRWVVPPQRAVWILPNTLHAVSSIQPFWLHTLYAEQDSLMLPRDCGVVSVSPLIQQLLVAAADFGMDYPIHGKEERLMRTLVDWLPLMPVAPLYLPQPQDIRLKKITTALEENMTTQISLDKIAQTHGLTERTAARLFIKETGLTFGQWRQQLRLLCALQKLAQGEKVTSVAFDVGYQDVSSFISLFKKAFGTTPGQYL